MRRPAVARYGVATPGVVGKCAASVPRHTSRRSPMVGPAEPVQGVTVTSTSSPPLPFRRGSEPAAWHAALRSPSRVSRWPRRQASTSGGSAWREPRSSGDATASPCSSRSASTRNVSQCRVDGAVPRLDIGEHAGDLGHRAEPSSVALSLDFNVKRHGRTLAIDLSAGRHSAGRQKATSWIAPSASSSRNTGTSAIVASPTAWNPWGRRRNHVDEGHLTLA